MRAEDRTDDEAMALAEAAAANAASAQELRDQAQAFGELLRATREADSRSRHARRRSLFAVVLAMIAVAAALGAGIWSAQTKADAVKQSAIVRACDLVNARSVLPLHKLLETAQTAASRNPLPPGLTDESRAYYEMQRARADEFYGDALRDTAPIDCSRL